MDNTGTTNSNSLNGDSSSNSNQNQSNPSPNSSPTITAPKISTSQALFLAQGYEYFADANYYAEYIQNGNNPYYAVTIYSNYYNEIYGYSRYKCPYWTRNVANCINIRRNMIYNYI